MAKYGIYSHNKTDIESDVIFLCACDNRDSANYIEDALKYRDTGGRMDDSGLYEYYIKEEL